jgi:ABC-type transport system involved in multi-copper enzyme maturation permease subunit
MKMLSTVAIIRDTFREAFARKIFWGLFGLSAALVIFFLFVMKIDLVEGASATISVFGKEGRTRDVDELVRGVFGFVATFLYTWEMFLSVFASAGLIPSVLEPGRIELVLSKPVSRTHLLLGRFAGNLLVVSVNIVFLVLSVWLIFGMKTGMWPVSFLIAIPTTIFVFAVLLTVVVLVGVLWESTALATMISVALMIISPVLAQKELAAKLLSSEWSRELWRAIYYVLPKIYDLGFMTLETIRHNSVARFEPVLTSAAFGIAIMSLALYLFARRDF